MATYKALCNKCNLTQEYQAPITHGTEDIPPCPKCGGARSQVWINPGSGSGFILKGSGWHRPGGFSTKTKKGDNDGKENS